MSELDPGAAPRSKTQFVYEWLQQEILSGALPPGKRIRQQDVAKALGVSYTPVREAIRQLQATGLITYEPNRGNAVNSLSEDALTELYLLRGAVEGLGARLAAARITEEQMGGLRALHERMEQILGESSGERVSAESSAVLADLSRKFHAAILLAGGPNIVHPKAQEIWSHYPVPQPLSRWTSASEARRSVDAHREILDALDARDAALAGSLMEGHIVAGVQFRVEAAASDA
jgi:DNA-binding GntR family transcriptional regulator